MIELYSLLGLPQTLDLSSGYQRTLSELTVPTGARGCIVRAVIATCYYGAVEVHSWSSSSSSSSYYDLPSTTVGIPMLITDQPTQFRVRGHATEANAAEFFAALGFVSTTGKLQVQFTN